MRAGKLRHLIQVKTPTRVADGAGGFSSVAWVPIRSDLTGEAAGSVWASVEPLSGRLSFEAQQLVPGVTHDIRIRYIPGVTPKCRIEWSGRVFHIRSIVNILERNSELRLLCEEVPVEVTP